MGLTRPRRAVQQQTALEVLAGAEQFGGPVGDADDVPLDVLEHPVGQDDIPGGDRRLGQERDQLVSVVLALGKAEHLAAEHVIRPHQPLDLIARRGGRRPVRREHLQRAQRRAEPAFVADADHDRGAGRRRRANQAERHHLGVLRGPDRGGAVAGGADRCTAPGRAAADHGPGRAGRPSPAHNGVRRHAEQRQHVLVRAVTAPRRAEPLRASGVRREVGIDPALDVHVLPAREPLRNQHHLGQLTAEMPGDPQRQPGGARLPAQLLCRQLKQLAHATRQPPEVFTARSGRHAPGLLAFCVTGTGGCSGSASRSRPRATWYSP
jgi:hypothetical protein